MPLTPPFAGGCPTTTPVAPPGLQAGEARRAGSLARQGSTAPDR